MFWKTFSSCPQICSVHLAKMYNEIDGIFEVAYITNNTPMISYTHVHFIFEYKRKHAKDVHSSNLGCIVVRWTYDRKNSLTWMLLDWTTRRGWNPTSTNLDIGQDQKHYPSDNIFNPKWNAYLPNWGILVN